MVGGGGVVVTVNNLTAGAKIGIYAQEGCFTRPMKEEYAQYFFSNVSGMQVYYKDGCLYMGTPPQTETETEPEPETEPSTESTVATTGG